MGQRLAAIAAVLVAIALTSVVTRLDWSRSQSCAGHVVAAWNGARFHGRGRGVFQVAVNDCGPAALAHALQTLGARAKHPDPASSIRLGARGCGFDQLVEEAARLGFRAHVHRMSSRSLEGVSPPALLFVDGGHFIVFEGLTAEGRVRLHDPALGSISYSPAALRRHWGGEILLLEPPGREEDTSR